MSLTIRFGSLGLEWTLNVVLSRSRFGGSRCSPARVDDGRGAQRKRCETMQAGPFSGAVYVFRAKRADRVKLIYWDGTGYACSPSVLGTASSAGRACRMP